jgi:hypothetical protein
VLELSLRKWSELARFEILRSVLMKFSVFWDVTLYMLLYNHRSEYSYVPVYTASCPRRVESCYIETWKFSRKRELNIFGSSEAMTYRWIGISGFGQTSCFHILYVNSAVKLETADWAKKVIPFSRLHGITLQKITLWISRSSVLAELCTGIIRQIRS